MQSRQSRFKSTLQQIKNNDPSLTKIKVIEDELSIEKISSLCKALEKNTAVKSVSMRGVLKNQENKIAVCKMLKVNTAITLIDLSDNDIGDCDAEMFSQTILRNCSLKKIFIWNHNLSKDGIETIYDAIICNYNLLEIIGMPTNNINNIFVRNNILDSCEKLLISFKDGLNPDKKNIDRKIVALEDGQYNPHYLNLHDDSYPAVLYKLLKALISIYSENKKLKIEACKYLLLPNNFLNLKCYADILLSNILAGDICPVEEPQLEDFSLLISQYHNNPESIDEIKQKILEFLFARKDEKDSPIQIVEQKTKLTGVTTPLHDACKERRTELCEDLIIRGAEVNAVDENGKTPLYIACTKDFGWGSPQITLLLQNGADVNHQCNPFYIACQYGNSMAVNLIIETTKLKNIDMPGVGGHSPLQVACLSPHTKGGNYIDLFFNNLLMSGASLTHKNDKGQTAIEIALERFHFIAVKAILNYIQKMSISPNEIMSLESLQLAKEWIQDFKQTELIAYFKWNYLLDEPISQMDVKFPDLSESEIDLFIMECFKNKKLLILRMLLSLKKADVGLLVSREHKTYRAIQFNRRLHGVHDKSERLFPLLHFAICEWPDAVPLLLELGACVFSTDYHAKWVEKNYGNSIMTNYYEFFDKGRSALHSAIIENNNDLIRLLIEKGANVNVVDEIGQTPLHMASLYNNVQAIELLIDKSANKECYFKSNHKYCTVKSDSEWRITPLIVAMYSQNIQAIMALLNHGCDVKGAIEWASLNCDMKMIKVLLSSKKIDLNNEDLIETIKNTKNSVIQNFFNFKRAWPRICFFANNSELPADINQQIKDTLCNLYRKEFNL